MTPSPTGRNEAAKGQPAKPQKEVCEHNNFTAPAGSAFLEVIVSHFAIGKEKMDGFRSVLVARRGQMESGYWIREPS